MAARRKTLTPNQLERLPRRAKRYYLADPVQQGLVLRIPPQGPIGYSAVAWRGGKQTWKAVGTTATVSLDEARALARDVCRKIVGGQPLTATPLRSVGAVADLWLKLKVDADGYRTAKERRRIVDRYIRPHIGGLIFTDLRRSQVADLLDVLSERHGKAQADAVLTVLSAVCRWYERRDDEYRSPIVAGMSPAPATQRERVLGDDEIRTLWRVADASGACGAFLKLALLTGQRRDKLQTLRWEDIGADGVWRMRREPREKQAGGDLKLPPLALEIIYSQPRLVSDPRVFRQLDSRADARFRKAAGLPHWTVHDLRRTARSLMSRAGVQTEISERVLGHALQGVRKTYDRHEYFEEKSAALIRLAVLVERIINPSDSVVMLGAAS
jgi:integrase